MKHTVQGQSCEEVEKSVKIIPKPLNLSRQGKQLHVYVDESHKFAFLKLCKDKENMRIRCSGHIRSKM